jgi:hypothetical protein
MTTTSGGTIEASVDYLAMAKAFFKRLGKISKSKDPQTDTEEAERLRKAFLTPDGLKEAAVVIERMMGGYVDVTSDTECMELIVRAKYGPEADLRAIIMSIAANVTTTPVASIPDPIATNPPATLPNEKGRGKKKGSKSVNVSLGPPAPPVPTRTLRGAAKRNADQAALEDGGSSLSTRPTKTQRSE